jgi:prevent-host-death family protein
MTQAKTLRKQKRDTVPAETVRDRMREVFDRAEFGGERIVVTRNKRLSVAVVSIKDLEKIEAVA